MDKINKNLAISQNNSAETQNKDLTIEQKIDKLESEIAYMIDSLATIGDIISDQRMKLDWIKEIFALRKEIKDNNNFQECKEAATRSHARFFESLRKLGLIVNEIVEPEIQEKLYMDKSYHFSGEAVEILAQEVVTAEDMRNLIENHLNLEPVESDQEKPKRPFLIWTGHKGSGVFEDSSWGFYEKAGINAPNWIVKKSLLDLPFFGEILKKVDAIAVSKDRKEKPSFVEKTLNKMSFSSDARKKIFDLLGIKKTEKAEAKEGISETERLAVEIYKRFLRNESCIIALRGTRDKEIKFQDFPEKMNSYFRKMDPENKLGIQNAMTVIETLSAWENPIEKKPFGATRARNNDITLKLMNIDDDIDFKYSEGDNPNNIFGLMRSEEIKMLEKKYVRLKTMCENQGKAIDFEE